MKTKAPKIKIVHHLAVLIIATLTLSVILMLVIATNIALSTTSEAVWSTKSTMSTARVSAASGVINNKLYVVGGGTGTTPPTTTSLEIYNPSTNSWDNSKASAISSRAGASAAVINGKLYVVGGCINTDCRIGVTDTLEVYDPSSDSWSTLSSMPTPRSWTTAQAINGKLYVVGGLGPCPPCSPMLGTLEIYNPSTDTWSTGAEMPTPRSSLSSGVIDGKLYAVGGSNDINSFTGAVEVYNPSTNSWDTSKEDMLYPRVGAVAGVINGNLYVTGGIDGSGPVAGTEVYSPQSDSWISYYTDTLRNGVTGGVINNQLYVAGGQTGSTVLNKLETLGEIAFYDPFTDDPHTDDPHTDDPPVNDNCSHDYNPVCGVDEETYTNYCEAESHNIEVYHFGSCDPATEKEQMDAVDKFIADSEALLKEVEELKNQGYDVSTVESMFQELFTVTKEDMLNARDEQSFWEVIADINHIIEEISDEIEIIKTQKDTEISTEDLTQMNNIFQELDNAMRQLGVMLDWFKKIGADVDSIEPIFKKATDFLLDAKNSITAKDTEAFSKAIEDLTEVMENEFLPELIKVMEDSELIAYLEDIDNEMQLIEDTVSTLKQEGKKVPSSYDEITKIFEEIGTAFDNGDFLTGIKLIDDLAVKVDEFWDEIGNDHTIGFEPPAGFEDEVITTTGKNPFPDTNINEMEGKAASYLYSNAIIGGFPDGEFKGGQPVNRAEAAKFLLLAANIEVQDLNNDGKFKDVLDDQWYTPFVMTCAQFNIINGYPDGTFKPGNTVNTAEFLKMLSITFRLKTGIAHSFTDVPTDQWYSQYAGIASQYNLFPNRGDKLQPERELTRNEVAVAIYQYLTK